MDTSNLNSLQFETTITTPESHTTTKRVKRTRVSRACDFCRRKKIKCDIDQRIPCSSCDQYHWECTSIDAPTKKREPPKGYIESLEMRLRKMERLLKDQQSSINNNKEQDTNNMDSINLFSQPSTSSQESKKSIRIMRHIGSSSAYYLMGKEHQEIQQLRHQQGNSTLSSSFGHDTENPLIVSTPQGEKLHLVYDEDNNDLMVMYDLPTSQSQIDGIDGILSGFLVQKLLRRFMDLRPSMQPIVREPTILRLIQNHTDDLLLTCSICSYVCMVSPKDDPIFNSQDINREKIIQKLAAKENELLRTAFLTPTISNIQAIIILCCLPTHVSSFTAIWLRTGIAIRMSQDLGLYRSLTNTSYSKKTCDLSQRLWYSVYIMDRWSCAVLGRPLAIVDADCNVELPEYQPAICGDSTKAIAKSSTDNVERELEHTYFIQFVKLSGILGEIQRRIYSPKAKANLGTDQPRTRLMVNSLQRFLLEWYSQLPLHCRVTEDDISLVESMDPKEKQILLESMKWQLGAPLAICYYAVTILLHRPFIIPDNEVLFSPESAKWCTESAIIAHKIAQFLDMSSLAHFSWNILVYALSVVVSIFMYNCTSDQQEVSDYAYKCMNTTIKSMWNRLETRYPYAPKLVSFSPLHYATTILKLKGLQESSSSSPSTPTTRTPSSSNDKCCKDDNNGKSQDTMQQEQTIPLLDPTINILDNNATMTNMDEFQSIVSQDIWQQLFLKNTDFSFLQDMDTQNGQGSFSYY
ncbi:fungal-specific transcription factor domain-containing protein [Halteromyces radiatus]|uniref:fungal-specific transcription factor domain-containing protein n=1 Tax=Halteromyces radiatus TaxID=101107 RepID=UPI00222042A5|nr:fungal-specific transcription factor domain-containing protein [Halteromyces radiatus]KAI8088656.1 fungal-specific transcription factor domain-containing protein [Halteromyces radiatus]